MKKILKENFAYISFCIIIMIVNLFYINNIFLNTEKLCNIGSILIAQIIVFILEIIFCTLIKVFIKKNFSLEKIFLMVAIPLGLIYLISIPMGENPDEYAHFSRVYEITQGKLITSLNENNDAGAEIPIEMVENAVNGKTENYSEILELIKKPNSNQTIFHGFYNTALYNFVSYLFIIIGVFFGKILNIPVILVGYIGRLFNLIAWITLMYFTIKITPFLKKFILFIALIPITIAEATAITADAFTFAMSSFYICYILHLIYTRKDKINWKDNLILTLSAIIISLCKIIYLPLCLLLLLIPNEKYDSKKKKYTTNIAIILASIIANLIWLKIASRFLVKLNPGVNSAEQLKFILSNPFNFLQVIFNSISYHIEEYTFSLFGRSVAGTGTTSVLYIFACICIFVSFILKQKETIPSYFFKVLTILVVLAITGLMFCSLYLQWTPVGKETIDGVQGRYFLPYIILIPLAFLKVNKKRENSNNSNLVIYENNNIDYIVCFMVFYNIYMLIEIFAKFL